MKRCCVLILILLVSCAPWMKVGGVYKNTKEQYSVDLPQDWMKFNSNEQLLVSRDGPLLQNIIIERVDINEELEHTKKKLQKSMLPQEASEVIIDNISSDSEVLNLNIIENIPITIDLYPGFKIFFTYNNKDGLNFRSIYCGFLSGDWLYTIKYTAADRHYFQNDVAEFEHVLNSFRLLSEGK